MPPIENQVPSPTPVTPAHSAGFYVAWVFGTIGVIAVVSFIAWYVYLEVRIQQARQVGRAMQQQSQEKNVQLQEFLDADAAAQ